VSHAYLGLALAYMGRRVDAIREGERGLALVRISKGSGARTDLQHLLARIYILARRSIPRVPAFRLAWVRMRHSSQYLFWCVPLCISAGTSQKSLYT
jgi:hypothetical protein